MTDTDVVTARGLRKVYGGRVVVDNVDFDVPAGQVVGLIGANGAGKTTTVECIQGLRRLDGGTLRVLGLDPGRQADKLRPQLGSQLQDSALPDRLRVGEAVDLFATSQSSDANELLAQFDMLKRRRTPFAALSGGERQRLFLVLALLNRPRLVILDELTQGLDPAARRGVWAGIAQLRSRGTTVLLVTHEMDEAEALCDSVIVMRSGRVLETGSPAALVARHAGWATVRFSWPHSEVADMMRDLREITGVREVSVAGDRISAQGERHVIAHIGADLVRRGRIPDDLTVEIPNLESALLGLLKDQDAAPGPVHVDETAGASR